MRTVLLKGEVPVGKRELEALRRRSAELDDYMAAIRSPQVQQLRQRAMTLRRTSQVHMDLGWAKGILDYENALGDALVALMRGRS